MTARQGVPASRIKAILFDKDGTLFDFATTWEAWARGFLLRAAEGDEALAAQAGAQIGFDMENQRFARDSIVIAGTASDIAQLLRPMFPAYTPEGFLQMLNAEAAAAPQAEAVPLVPFLTALRGRGLKLGVATNDAEAPARAHLDKAGVIPLLDFIAGSDSGYGGKPAPGQLLGFVEAVGIAPADTVMVGDSLHDLHAGRAAGMRCVGVLTGLATQAELAPFADVVLPDIGALPAWLDAQDAG